MYADPFFVGRYIYWQGTVSQICAFSATGEVWLEHFFTRRSHIVDLATLQEALAAGSLFIGVAIEREATATKSDELLKGLQSSGNQDRTSEDVVITYIPSLNVESFFTTSQSPAKKRRFIRHEQRRSNRVSKRGVKLVRHPTMVRHRAKKSHLQNTHVPHMHPPLAKMRDKRHRTLTKPAGEQYKAAEIQRAFQGPGKLTIRWLNCRKSDFSDLSPLATSSHPKHPRSLATQNWEVDHRLFDLFIPGYQGLAKPNFNMLIDTKSGMVIGWYLAFRHV